MKRVRALTHSGVFHADEVTAFAILRVIEPDLDRRFLRSRDPDRIDKAEIVFDVGGVYDPARRRYDHHMRDAPKRPDGDPYSSAGLVWRDFGRDALRAILGPQSDSMLDTVWHHLDQSFILPIDRVDNGLQHADGLSYVSLIDDLNPPWTEPEADPDDAFLAAADLAETVLRRKAIRILGQHCAPEIVLEAAGNSADPRLLELPVNLPWQAAAFEAGLPVLFAIYRDHEGLWRIDCMPSEPGSFEQRLPLPEAWAGLRDEALQRASGIPDAVFVHRARFTGGARSREGALAMARQALALAPPDETG